MRVAFVISTLDLGGAQRAVSNITLGLGNEWDIDIILNSDANIEYPYRGNIISLGIETPKTSEKRKGLVYQGIVFFKRIKTLKRIKREKKYDAIVSFLDSANIANILTRKGDEKIIVSVRSNLSMKEEWKYKCIVGKLVKYSYNQADAVVALSEGVKKDLVNNYNILEKKVVTIYNGYDIQKIIDQSIEESPILVDKHCINIITMGRLNYPKGQWHLIRAFKKIYRNNSKARLYILGIGELEPYLTKLIHELHLEDVVYLCGFVSNPYSVLAKMDIFVFPSMYEGFGNAMLEAMICGLPCIATDFRDGAREILADEFLDDYRASEVEYSAYGILLPVMSGEYYTAQDELDEKEEILVKAISTLIEDEDLRKRYSQKAVERARHFGIEQASTKWRELIRSNI